MPEASYSVWRRVEHLGQAWHFDKEIPVPPISPFIGMGIYLDCADGEGDSCEVVGVTWCPSENRVELQLDIDKWADDSEAIMGAEWKSPVEVYEADGWKQ